MSFVSRNVHNTFLSIFYNVMPETFEGSSYGKDCMADVFSLHCGPVRRCAVGGFLFQPFLLLLFTCQLCRHSRFFNHPLRRSNVLCFRLAAVVSGYARDCPFKDLWT